MRRTKIICTLGPKTESEDSMRKLIASGMNIARINLSHGEMDWHAQTIQRLKNASKDSPFPIALLLDTQGPEIRTSTIEVELHEGDTFKIAFNSACDIREDEKHTFVNYSDLASSVKKGDVILIDEGPIALEVQKIDKFHVSCKVLNKGKVGQKKSVNLPGIRTKLPAVTQRDKECIAKLVPLGIDFIAQSFVSRKEDIRDMRAYLASVGCTAKLIAKIENQSGIDHLDEIVAESDGVMVARGDLGVEIPLEQIPIVQHLMVKKCIAQGKPVIIATHLLESMIHNPRPTRAEVTDVANAVFQKADAIMLSAETTKGEYPLECVKTMHRIAKNVQVRLRFEPPVALQTENPQEAISVGACINADSLKAKAIVVFSRTGNLLSFVTKRRPNTDLFVFTDSEETRRQVMLHWSSFSFPIHFKTSFNQTVDEAIEVLKKRALIVEGDKIIIISDIIPKRGIETLEIRTIE